MIVLPLMLALSQTPTTSVTSADVAAPGADAIVPPGDWSHLPELSLQQPRPAANALAAFVQNEVQAGRCSGNSPLRIDLAVLVAPDGRLRGVRPNAIGCPTVEQYASGLVMRMARSNVAAPPADQWYRTALTFAWQ